MRRPSIGMLALLLLAACSPGDGPQGIAPPEPDPSLVQHAVRLHVDVTRNTVEVVQPRGPAGAAASLLGHDAVTVISGPATTAAAHGSFRHVRFDVAVMNRLPGVTLTTSTFPTPPRGASGIMLFPYSIEVTNGKGQVDASDEWDGAVHNFFDNRNCTSDVHCFRYEMFTGDLASGATTPARQVGFIVHRNVQSFDVFMVVAADLVPGALPNGSVAGIVMSPQRGAIAGAVVSLAPSGQSAATGADGAFAMPNVPPGPYVATVANLPSYCSAAAPQPVAVQSGMESSVSFSVTCTAPAGALSGTVSSAYFGGVAATVSAGGVSTRTDENGAYTLTGLAPGTHMVTVSDLPEHCTGAAPQEAAVTDGGSTSNVDFDVVCSGSVVVHVTGTGRGPIGNAVVQLVAGGPKLSTDANGSVTFTDVIEGPGVASVVQNPWGCTAGGSPFVVETEVTVVTVNLECPAATGTISGVVTSSFGPLSVAVSVGTLGTNSGPDGRYTMSRIPVGTHQVTIANVPANCTTPAPKTADVTEAQTTTVDFDVACTGSVTVNVSGTGRGAIAGAVVQLDDSGATLTTDAAGNVTFTGISAGAHVARVLSTPFTCGTAVRSFTLSAPTASIAISLDCAPATGTIGGIVTTNDGTPIPVPLVEVEVGQRATMTIASGAYGVTDVPAGEVTITVNASRTRPCDPQQRTVTLAEGQTLDVSFSLNCPAPVAEAGAHTTAAAGGSFALNGTSSRAHNNVPMTFSWQELGGAFAANGPIAPVPVPQITRRVFRLTVNDGLRTATDQIEVFVLEETTGIFVNPMFGDDRNDGTHHWAPLQTFEAALTRSIGLQKDIYITAGNFTAPQAQLAGVGSIYGGFVEEDWTRSPARTVLNVGAMGINIVQSPGIRLDQLEIIGADATAPGASAYGLRLFTSTSVRVTNSIVRAGNGAPGADGTDGVAGKDGLNGNPGQQGSNNGLGGAGGAGTITTSCSFTPCLGNAGGNGGRNGAGQDGLGNPMATTTQAATPGGRGGAAGDPGEPGQPGARGHDGDAGMDGLTASPTLSFSGGFLPGSGSNGLPGRDATFGSGGGGGGSQVCLFTCALSTGSGGGSGGTGGKGGTGGTGGQGGGASIALYLEHSAVDLEGTTLVAGNGGDGGDGGRGGAGGIGGQGGAGGPAPASAYGRGGNGGNGGIGGAGGNGASGNGGPSIAIVRQASSAIVRSTTILQVGAPGRGGASLPAGHDGQAVTIFP